MISAKKELSSSQAIWIVSRAKKPYAHLTNLCFLPADRGTATTAGGKGAKVSGGPTKTGSVGCIGKGSAQRTTTGCVKVFWYDGSDFTGSKVFTKLYPIDGTAVVMGSAVDASHIGAAGTSEDPLQPLGSDEEKANCSELSS